MAGKAARGTAFTIEACQELQKASVEAINLMNGKYESVQSIFAKLRNDEILGDSTSKENLNNVLNEVDSTWKSLIENLDRAQKVVDEVTAIATDSMKKNAAGMESAAQDVNKVAQNAQNVDGTGAVN